jgi:prophage antirepressor-like protein
MDIIKAFQKNEIGINITIQGTYEEPFFRASDIANVLEMTNIRVMLQNFDDTEKVVRNAYTLGGGQEVTFLTEKGLYQVLFTSRKPIAKTFKNWVCDVIKEIRVNGKYDFEQQLQLKNKEIEQLEIENISIKEKTLLNSFNKKTILYIGLVEFNIAKFGHTIDINERTQTHKKELGPQYILEYVIETNYNRELEKLIKGNLKDKLIMRRYPNRKNICTELIQLDEEFTIENLYNEVLQYVESIKDDLINKQRIEIKQLKSIITDYRYKFNEDLYEITTESKNKPIIRQNINPIGEVSICNRKIIDRPSLEELIADLNILKNMKKVGEKYGVSDNTIRKWIKNYDPDYVFLDYKTLNRCLSCDTKVSSNRVKRCKSCFLISLKKTEVQLNNARDGDRTREACATGS